MKTERHIAVIDPAVRIAEVDCFNRLVTESGRTFTYHLPVLGGTASLVREKKPAGVIILGSSSSVHDALPWQAPLSQWLLSCIEADIPTLGICYGHQLLAHLHGGQVGFRRADQTKRLGFDSLTLDAAKPWASVPNRGNVFFSHREAVTSLPPGMRAIGRSAESPYEVLAHERRPVWSFQSHPEATAEFARNCGYTESVDEKAFAYGHALVRAFLDYAT